ncbi:MAG: NAD-dependent epimerase/dehydratase family protein [Acidobacteria bacterium]|nr:NAD-dependent epimerase/dehydratase family protein [Acidobacteriota bacterium]
MARVLVTGGAGFIGSRYVHRAVGRGDRVTILDDLSRSGSAGRMQWLREELGTAAVDLVRVSVTDADAVAACCRDSDLVVHLAGQVAVTDSMRDPRHDFEVNALGTLNVLEGLRRHAPRARLVHASTNKVYGALARCPVEEAATRYVLSTRPHGIDESEPLDPQTPYACSNAAADQYVRDYARLYGLRAVVFRQSCIYGPGQFGSEDQGWVAWLMRAALRGDEVRIFGDGKQVRDLLYVDDLLDAFDLAMQRVDRTAGRAYNVGGGPGTSSSIWHEFRGQLADVTGAELRAELAPWRPADQLVYISDIRRASAELGWRPRTPLRDGLSALRDWLMRYEPQVAPVDE